MMPIHSDSPNASQLAILSADAAYSKEKPMQIGVMVLGNWGSTRSALEYFILYLNTKQTIFEYQLINLNMNISKYIENHSSEQACQLFKKMIVNRMIDEDKYELKRILNEMSAIIYEYISKYYSAFDISQIPIYYIFISPSLHKHTNFFQYDGTNGSSDDIDKGMHKGAIILGGHHKANMFPPSLIEFIFKFLFRISIKWKYYKFSRCCRHYGQKGCLFDFAEETRTLRYMILNNFICDRCREMISPRVCSEIVDTLKIENLYAENIDRQPANISSSLGYNLFLTKGIYRSKAQKVFDTVKQAALERAGSLMTISIIFVVFYASGFENIGFINED